MDRYWSSNTDLVFLFSSPFAFFAGKDAHTHSLSLFQKNHQNDKKYFRVSLRAKRLLACCFKESFRGRIPINKNTKNTVYATPLAKCSSAHLFQLPRFLPPPVASFTVATLLKHAPLRVFACPFLSPVRLTQLPFKSSGKGKQQKTGPQMTVTLELCAAPRHHGPPLNAQLILVYELSSRFERRSRSRKTFNLADKQGWLAVRVLHGWPRVSQRASAWCSHYPFAQGWMGKTGS